MRNMGTGLVDGQRLVVSLNKGNMVSCGGHEHFEHSQIRIKILINLEQIPSGALCRSLLA